MEHVTTDAERWREFHTVLDGPLPQIAERFSRFLARRVPHDALVIFTRECTGRPRKVAGAADIVDRVSIDELDEIKRAVPRGIVKDVTAVLGGSERGVLCVHDDSDTLLVIVPKTPRTGRLPVAAKTSRLGATRAVRIAGAPDDALIRAWFSIVATSIRQQVTQASPDYLAESRAASSERARTIAQLTEAHEDTLSSILGALRSRDLDDRTARATAAHTASTALIALRSVGDTDRELATEDATTAFSRLQAELEPVLRQLAAEVEYVRPTGDGRVLPGEIAHGARAIVRAVAVAFGAQESSDGPAGEPLARLRIAWDCRSDELVVDVRDQGPGGLDGHELAGRLEGRLRALDGRLDVESIAGWGSRVTARIPLATPERPGEDRLATLNPRELEVLGHLALGRRNKMIATQLGVSESTIKFHVTAILTKLQVSNRGEAGLLAAGAGIIAG